MTSQRISVSVVSWDKGLRVIADLEKKNHRLEGGRDIDFSSASSFHKGLHQLGMGQVDGRNKERNSDSPQWGGCRPRYLIHQLLLLPTHVSRELELRVELRLVPSPPIWGASISSVVLAMVLLPHPQIHVRFKPVGLC